MDHLADLLQNTVIDPSKLILQKCNSPQEWLNNVERHCKTLEEHDVTILVPTLCACCGNELRGAYFDVLFFSKSVAGHVCSEKCFLYVIDTVETIPC